MRAAGFALVLALAGAHVAAAGPQVTVYSHDLGFVRESRSLNLRTGLDTLRLEDISTQLDFSSVRLAPASGRLRRLAYRWDVASGDGLIENARGQRVRVLSRGDRVAEGTLLSADGSWLVLRTDDGGLTSLARAAVEQVQLAKPSGALALKPAIEAVVEGGHGSVAAELSYLTGGALVDGRAYAGPHRRDARRMVGCGADREHDRAWTTWVLRSSWWRVNPRAPRRPAPRSSR